MFKKKKSITQANSTVVKYKITRSKNNYKAIRNQFLEYKFVFNIFTKSLKLNYSVYYDFSEVEV